MKFAYSFLAFVALASAKLENWCIINTQDINVDLNKIVDDFTPSIAKFMVNHDLDPLKLPNIVDKFTMVIPIIPPISYPAQLTLHQGKLKYLSQLQRYGDATLAYNGEVLRLNVGFEFQVLEGSYDYILELLLDYNGHITASAKTVRARISVDFSTKNYTLSLNKFEIESLKNIKVNIETEIGLDWIINPITNVVIPLFQDLIKDEIEVETANAIRTFFEEINLKIPHKVLAYILEHQLIKRC